VVSPRPMEYWMATTDPKDNREMSELLKKMPLEQAVKRLAENFPHGISTKGVM